jgi:hypothetical protein
MSQKRYIVDLTDAEVQALETLLRTGKHSARKLTRARIFRTYANADKVVSTSKQELEADELYQIGLLPVFAQ